MDLKKREVRYEPYTDTEQISQYSNHLPSKLQTGTTYRADDAYMFVYEIANKISTTTTTSTASKTWFFARGKFLGMFVFFSKTLWLNYFDGGLSRPTNFGAHDDGGIVGIGLYHESLIATLFAIIPLENIRVSLFCKGSSKQWTLPGSIIGSF